MLEATELIKDELIELAYERSNPFCYMDYLTVRMNEDGEFRCPKCGSDDLMRELPGVGVEYGTEWIIKYIVENEGEKVDIEELYRALLDEVYEPVKFGELEYSASYVLETVDKVAFDIGVHEYAYSMVEDGLLISLGSSYYRMEDITD